MPSKRPSVGTSACCVLAVLAASLFGFGPPAMAAGPKDLTLQIGYALSPATDKNPIKFTLKQPVIDKGGNAPFTKGWTPTYQSVVVTVPNIDAIAPGDLADPKKLSADSKAKATAIADAIAGALADKTRVSVVEGNTIPIVVGSMPNPNFNPFNPRSPRLVPVFANAQLWNVVTTNINSMTVQKNPTGENGDGANFGPGKGGGGGGGGSGSMGSMSGMGYNATGVDPLGNPSYVEFGTDAYQSILFPTMGESDATLLDLMAEDLTDHGVSAAFDAKTDTLSLLSPIPDGQDLVFAWTDTGLNFTVNDVSSIPEPAGWFLMLAGVGVVGGALRRRTPTLRAATAAGR